MAWKSLHGSVTQNEKENTQQHLDKECSQDRILGSQTAASQLRSQDQTRYCRPLKTREKTESHHWAYCWIFSFRKSLFKSSHSDSPSGTHLFTGSHYCCWYVFHEMSICVRRYVGSWACGVCTHVDCPTGGCCGVNRHYGYWLYDGGPPAMISHKAVDRLIESRVYLTEQKTWNKPVARKPCFLPRR